MWNFERYSDKKAVISSEGIELTYNELNNQVQSFQKVVENRCLIFSLCSNSIGSLIGYAASINIHIVPLMLDANLENDLLDNLIKTYCPQYLWIPTGKKDMFPNYEICYQAFNYLLVKTHYENIYPLNDQLALLLTTSGSTGSPKLVRQSYVNLYENAKSIVEYLNLDSNERPITTLPMNYTYGISIINSHFLVGATILLTDKGIMQKEFWDFFQNKEATSFGGVPYTYEMLNRIRFFQMKLPSLKTMTQAGGKLIPELHKKFAEFANSTNRNFIVMYGQTEATARMGYLPAEKSLEKCGSMGIAIPGGRFSLINSDGQLINDADITGELVYEGKNVTLGYAENGIDLIKDDEFHGRLETGDMALKDRDGYYYIVGRKKRFLKIFGNRINLDEIERMVKSEFSSLDCACGGIDDRMTIFITNHISEKEVQSFISQKTKLNPKAFSIVTIDSIPQNEAGKTQYKELEKYYDN